jgi:hypothetical protein
MAIVLSVLLRFTDSDYPFGIFKLLSFENWIFRQPDRDDNHTAGHTAKSNKRVVKCKLHTPVILEYCYTEN